MLLSVGSPAFLFSESPQGAYRRKSGRDKMPACGFSLFEKMRKQLLEIGKELDGTKEYCAEKGRSGIVANRSR